MNIVLDTSMRKKYKHEFPTNHMEVNIVFLRGNRSVYHKNILQPFELKFDYIHF